jgi:hypothetical protein
LYIRKLDMWRDGALSQYQMAELFVSLSTATLLEEGKQTA